MKNNVCRQFKLEPVPVISSWDLSTFDKLFSYLENAHQANLALLEEVAKLRDEVNTLRGL